MRSHLTVCNLQNEIAIPYERCLYPRKKLAVDGKAVICSQKARKRVTAPLRTNGDDNRDLLGQTDCSLI